MPSTIRTRRSSRNLLEKANVGVVQNPHVRNVVALQRCSRWTQAERPARVALGVHPRRFQDARMHHARPEDLRPAASFAHGTAPPFAELAFEVELRRGLGEWEVAGPEPRARSPEEPAREV